VPCRQWLLFDAAESAARDLIPSRITNDGNDRDQGCLHVHTAAATAAAADAVEEVIAKVGASGVDGDAGVVASASAFTRGGTLWVNSQKVAVVAAPGEAGVRALLGATTVGAVAELRLILAGAGGVGREVLRCWALMGAGGCGGRGGGGGSVCVIDGAEVNEHDLARGGLLRPGGDVPGFLR